MPANTGTKLHGKNGAIYITSSKEGGGQKVLGKAEWTLSLSRDYVDATVFGDKNKTYLTGLADIQGTYSGFLDVSGDLMVNNSFSDAVMMYLYADDAVNTTSKYLVAYGPALMDSSINASNSDAIRITGNFRASATTSVSAWKIYGNDF